MAMTLVRPSESKTGLINALQVTAYAVRIYFLGEIRLDRKVF